MKHQKKTYITKLYKVIFHTFNYLFKILKTYVDYYKITIPIFSICRIQGIRSSTCNKDVQIK